MFRRISAVAGATWAGARRGRMEEVADLSYNLEAVGADAGLGDFGFVVVLPLQIGFAQARVRSRGKNTVGPVRRPGRRRRRGGGESGRRRRNRHCSEVDWK